MRPFKFIAALLIAASAALGATLKDTKAPQLANVTPPSWVDVVVSPAVNSLWGFDANKTLSNVTAGTGITISGGVISAPAVGTVTSFSAGNLSPLFTTSVATATSTPALSFALSTQVANTVFAGPATGVDAAPTFRALVNADIPTALTGKTYNGLTLTSTTATLTLASGSSLITSGAFASTFTFTGITGVTFPTSGTLATTAGTVASFSAGTTGFTPSSATTGAVTLAGTLGTANGGTNLTSFTSGGLMQAASTSALTTTLTPSGLTSLGVNSITAASATDLTLAGGSSGASLTLGQGASGNITLAPAAGGVTTSTRPLQLVTPATGSAFRVWFGSGNNLPLTIGAQRNSGDAYLGWNADQSTGDTQTYAVSNAATRIRGNGSFEFYVAPSGTSGNAITWTRVADFTATGNLLVGTTSDLSSVAGGFKSVATGAGATATNSTSGQFQLSSAGGTIGMGGGAGYFSNNVQIGGLAQLDVTNANGRALIVGPVAQSGGNLPYVSIKTSASFADFALNLENTNSTSGQGLGLRIVAGSTTSDFPLSIRDRLNASTLFSVLGTGHVTAAGVYSAGFGTVNLASTDPVLRFYDSDGTTDKKTVELRKIGASGFEGLQFRKVNDANAVFTSQLYLWDSGGLYLGSGTSTDPGAGVLRTEGNIVVSGTGTSSFAGALSIAGNLTGIVAGNFSDSLNGTRANSSASVYTLYITGGGGQQWQSGLRAGDSLYHLAYDNTLGLDRITVAPTTGLTTFGTTTASGSRLGERIELNTSANYGGGAFNSWNATGQHPLLDFQVSASATIGTHAAVGSSANLGQVTFRGSDGTGFIDAAYIRGEVNGTVATNQVPGRITMWIANSAGTIAERARFSATAVDFSAITTAGTSTTNAAFKAYSAGLVENLFVGGNLTVTGPNAAIGTTTGAQTALAIGGTSLTGTSQFALDAAHVATSSATTASYGARFKVALANAAFTMANGYGGYIDTPLLLGSTNALTTNTGLFIANQGAARVTNAYGIDIAAQSGAATLNVGLRNAGTTLLSNTTVATSSDGALRVSNTGGAHTNIGGGQIYNTGEITAVGTGSHVFGTTNTVTMTAGVLSTTGAINSGGLVTASAGLTVASGQDLRVGNAFVATPQVATGYIVIKDSTGTAYKVSANP